MPTGSRQPSRASSRQESRRYRAVVGDDHPLYRDALVRAVSLSGEIEVVGAYEDGRAALDGIREHEPDVAVIDFRMPDIDGVALTHAVIRDKLGTRVLIVSA